MNRCCLAAAALLAVAGSLAMAQPSHKESKAAQPAGEHALPPGMTAEDMQACMEAGAPGENHEYLVQDAGVWKGKTKMWMTPDMTEPMTSECTSTVTPMMDGRFVRCEITGDMPGMGVFNGFGLYGFDNVQQKFQSTWIDNCGTGMMTGTGELSSDGKTLTWTFNYHCPITKKATVMREVERRTGANSKTLEMWGTDPKSGKEFKMMEIAFTRDNAKTAGVTSDTSK